MHCQRIVRTWPHRARPRPVPLVLGQCLSAVHVAFTIAGKTIVVLLIRTSGLATMG